MEVPDRLPFEVIERLNGGAIRFDGRHHLGRPITVMATKGTGTVRPFVRLPAVDLLVYQALVDAAAPAIEGALLDRQTVFAYRLDLVGGTENQFEGTPTWRRNFMPAAREQLEASPDAYCLRADIAGYFLQVDVTELERSLLESGVDGRVARDLGELLRGWQMLGIRGLPQGLPPSSPLGNFYLRGLDGRVAGTRLPYLRYMDDIWVFTDSFSQAREVQDDIERTLYGLGMTLSGDKSRVERRRTALERVTYAAEIIAARQEMFREGVEAMAEAGYVDEDYAVDPAAINAAAVLDVYSDIIEDLREDDYPPGFRETLREVFRELSAATKGDAIPDVPWLLARFPDLTGDGASYVARAAAENEAAAAAAEDAMATILVDGRFHREQELLQICRSALYMARSARLAPLFAALAIDHPHELVRARALLAWGALSAPDDFATADLFWGTAGRLWRIYPLVAIQDKDEVARNERYVRWSGEGRSLGLLADQIRLHRFSWRKI
jgi:hypothetical protein